MKHRTFGRTGWEISDIAVGLWGMGEWSGSKDEESLKALQLAVDLGCNFFDSAWAYGNGNYMRHPRYPPRTTSGRPRRNIVIRTYSLRTTFSNTPTQFGIS